MEPPEEDGDPIRLRECIEVHLRTGEVMKAAVPQGLGRFIMTENHESNVVGISYLRGTGGGHIFHGFYTHLMEERDWSDYHRQQPTEWLVSNRRLSTAFADNDHILRERLEAMVSDDNKD